MDSIRIATSDADILATFELMAQLHDRVHQLSRQHFLDLIRTLERDEGYIMACLDDGGAPVCVSGFRLCHSIGWGKYLYVDDLVTDESQRSRGAGQMMFRWLVARARAEECSELRLDCRVDRIDAHRFYFRERMHIRCFHFRTVV